MATEAPTPQERCPYCPANPDEQPFHPEVRITLPCDHSFHTSCWFIRQSLEEESYFYCPECREDILGADEIAYMEKLRPVSRLKTADQVWATDETFRTEVRGILKKHLLYKKLYAAQEAARKTVLEGFRDRTRLAVKTLHVEAERARKELTALPGRQKVVQTCIEIDRRLRDLKNKYDIKFTLLESHLRPLPDAPKRGWFRANRYGPEWLEKPSTVLWRALREILQKASQG